MYKMLYDNILEHKKAPCEGKASDVNAVQAVAGRLSEEDQGEGADSARRPQEGAVGGITLLRISQVKR
jgi:hypothetical protein